MEKVVVAVRSLENVNDAKFIAGNLPTGELIDKMADLQKEGYTLLFVAKEAN